MKGRKTQKLILQKFFQFLIIHTQQFCHFPVISTAKKKVIFLYADFHIYIHPCMIFYGQIFCPKQHQINLGYSTTPKEHPPHQGTFLLSFRALFMGMFGHFILALTAALNVKGFTYILTLDKTCFHQYFDPGIISSFPRIPTQPHFFYSYRYSFFQLLAITINPLSILACFWSEKFAQRFRPRINLIILSIFRIHKASLRGWAEDKSEVKVWRFGGQK